jgi:hypothetical protein
MERASSSETLVYAYHTIQHNIPEENNLRFIHLLENLKSQNMHLLVSYKNPNYSMFRISP